jgi:hypothetical protein
MRTIGVGVWKQQVVQTQLPFMLAWLEERSAVCKVGGMCSLVCMGGLCSGIVLAKIHRCVVAGSCFGWGGTKGVSYIQASLD